MPYLERIFRAALCLPAALLFLDDSAMAQDRVRGSNRITESINNSDTVVRRGDVHPLARAEYNRGLAPAGMRMERMVLVLQPDAAQQQALEDFLAAQQDPASQDYQRWLTPEAFGDRFGISSADLDQIAAWLESSGFDVEPP